MDNRANNLSIEEFAKRSDLSVATIRRRVREGKIPVYQPGGPRTRMSFSPEILMAPPTPHVTETLAPAPPPLTSADRPVDVKAPDRLPGPLPKWKQRSRPT